MKLISEMQDTDEKNRALDTVISYAQLIASMLASGAINHYTQHSSVNGVFGECSNRVVAVKSIYEMLEKSLKKYCTSNTSRLVAVQKAENSFLSKNGKFFNKMVDYLKKALIYGHTSRISSWIYYQFTTFEGKSLDMPPGTLQAQPPAHSIEKE